MGVTRDVSIQRIRRGRLQRVPACLWGEASSPSQEVEVEREDKAQRLSHGGAPMGSDFRFPGEKILQTLVNSSNSSYK